MQNHTKITYAISDFPIYGGVFRPRNLPTAIEFSSHCTESHPQTLTIAKSVELAGSILLEGSQVISQIRYHVYNKTSNDAGELLVLRVRDPKENIFLLVTSEMQILHGSDIEMKFQGLNAMFTIG